MNILDLSLSDRGRLAALLLEVSLIFLHGDESDGYGGRSKVFAMDIKNRLSDIIIEIEKIDGREGDALEG